MGSVVSGFAHWDRALFDALNTFIASPFLDAVMPVLSSAAVWFLPLGVAWIVFVVRTNRRGRLIAIGCFLLVTATDQLASSVVKPIVARVRPCNVVPSAHYYHDGKWLTTDKFGLTTYKSSFSFPSSHATNVAGQAAYWGTFYPQVAPLLIVAALSVGVSRVYLGHHWPLDVAGGYLLGLILALLFARLLSRYVLPDE